MSSHAATGPAVCPECQHRRPRPVLVPPRHALDSCRVIVSASGLAVERCGCHHVVHRVRAAERPRHRRVGA